MELSYIREFVVLAETGNYLEAADTLFIAQSSLSRHIKSIEIWEHPCLTVQPEKFP